MIIGTAILEKTIIGYTEPMVSRSLLPVLTAGPIEESLFYGIPFYATGNHLLVLASGILWVMVHILNTKSLAISTLAYANWLFVIPSFFYSFRTWISGKGWFAIVAHSTWNGIFFSLGCVYGEYECSIVPKDIPTIYTLGSMVLATVLLILTLFLYIRKASARRRISYR